jgi:hypothetical protein
MRTESRRLMRVGLATCVLGLAVSPAMAQQENEAREPATILALEHQGLEQMMPSEKDAALLKAIQMLPTRFKELKAHPSTGEDIKQVPDRIVDLVWDIVRAPMRLAVTHGGVDPNSGMPAIGVLLSFGMDDRDAAMQASMTLDVMREQTGMQMPIEPSARFDGMQQMALPFGMLTFGPREAADGWRYELMFGQVEDPDAMMAPLPEMPAGVRGVARARFDFAALTPISEMAGGMMAMFAPQGVTIMQKAREQGFVGPEAIAVDYTAGFTRDGSISIITMRGAGQYADAMGLMRQPLDVAQLAIIPADAYAVDAGSFDLQRFWTEMQTGMTQMGGQSEQVDEALAQFREMTGVDFEQDIVNTLGTTIVSYIADSSGGNSLLSTVVAMHVEDPDRLRTAMDKLAATLNGMASEADLGPGSVRLQKWGERNLTSLRFPGLPIPFEPTFSLAEDWLIMGATPQACYAATEQAVNKTDGIMANKAFRSAYQRGLAPVGVGFIDVGATMSDGYAVTTLLGSMLQNFVRSPENVDRDPGMVVGTLGSLKRNVKPMMTLVYWDGEDYVTQVTADSSAVANIAGIVGVGDVGTLFTGGLIGAGITAGIMENQKSSGHYNEWEAAPTSEEEDVEY